MTAPNRLDIFPNSDPLLTTVQAAAWLGVARPRLDDWRKAGVGPAHVVIGRRSVRYRLSAVKEFVALHERPMVEVVRAKRKPYQTGILPLPKDRQKRRWNDAGATLEGDEPVRAALWRVMEKAGGLSAWARAVGMTVQFASLLLNGKRTIAPKLARELGFNYCVVIRYVRIPKRSFAARHGVAPTGGPVSPPPVMTPE